MNKGKTYLIGISPEHKNLKVSELLNKCQAIAASPSILKAACEIYDITPDNYEHIAISPVKRSLQIIEDKAHEKNIAVLASGDPSFFGIGNLLIQTLGKDNVEIFPSISSMQVLFSRLKMNWDDATFISLHGRTGSELASKVRSSKKICILTDQNNNPVRIAQRLKRTLSETDLDYLQVYVGENLGSKQEKIITGNLNEIIGNRIFSSPNIMVIENDRRIEGGYRGFGLGENEIAHSRGLITKSEVRAVTIHCLCIPSSGIVWDIGGGSGSVSIEIARMNQSVTIYCIEKNQEEQKNIESNVQKFMIQNLILVKGYAPESLRDLPAPDRVFIGGSGGKLPEILDSVDEKLNQGGKIVVNGVLKKTIELAPELLHQRGYSVELRRVSVERMSYPDRNTTAFNPISIICGEKK